jgi:hypothetical protein
LFRHQYEKREGDPAPRMSAIVEEWISLKRQGRHRSCGQQGVRPFTAWAAGGRRGGSRVARLCKRLLCDACLVDQRFAIGRSGWSTLSSEEAPQGEVDPLVRRCLGTTRPNG